MTSARLRLALTGRHFGRLEAVARDADGKWRCLCDCGGEATVAVPDLTGGHTSSCGCLHRRKGADHPAWDASITSDERAIRAQRWRTQQIVTWRLAVFMRDGRRCVKCAAGACALNAHHLDGFDWCIDGRYDVDNGTTLCVPCHREYHARFGYRNTRSADFVRFLQDVAPPLGRVSPGLFTPISIEE